MKNSTTKKRTGKYTVIGIVNTLFCYVFFTILANLIIKNNDLLWLSSLISTLAAMIIAYILHSKITWKEKSPGKYGIYKFFLWNILLALFIAPFFTQIFSYITPLYELAFNISSALHLPFSYEFVLSTGAFVLASTVIMVLNFLFYDKLVFNHIKKEQNEK